MRQHHGPLLLSPFSGVASIFLKNILIIFLSPGLSSVYDTPCAARLRRPSTTAPLARCIYDVPRSPLAPERRFQAVLPPHKHTRARIRPSASPSRVRVLAHPKRRLAKCASSRSVPFLAHSPTEYGMHAAPHLICGTTRAAPRRATRRWRSGAQHMSIIPSKPDRTILSTSNPCLVESKPRVDLLHLSGAPAARTDGGCDGVSTGLVPCPRRSNPRRR